MNQNTPRNASSLIERAANVYDFKAVARAVPVPPVPPAPLRTVVERPAPTPEPRTAPAPAPVATPSRAEPEPRSPARPAPFRGRDGSIDREELHQAGFILPDAPISALAEEFRIVKRHLLLGAMGGQIDNGRVILVGSSQPNEGKTFCAVNLALSLANERDVEVLLVDADFAKPEILSMLGLEGGPGLLDAIADPGIDVESCIIRTDIPGLSVLPAGRQSNEVTELLASDHARDVLDRLAEPASRIVVLDSSPSLAASSASVLAFHAGQVLLVVRADHTSEAELREAVSMLGGCGNIAMLLNGVEFADGARRFTSSYGYEV